jgi:fatty acid desaturase
MDMPGLREERIERTPGSIGMSAELYGRCGETRDGFAALPRAPWWGTQGRKFKRRIKGELKMDLIWLLLTLALVGLVAWALVSFINMPQGFKTLIVAVALVWGVLFVLHAFGVSLPRLQVPTVRRN